MSNTVEIIVEGKNDATRVFVEVEKSAEASARRAEAEWSKSASASSTSVAKFGTEAEKAGQKAESGLRDGARKGGKAADDEMSKVAARTNAQFSAMTWAGLQFGLPAAAAAGVGGTAAILGGLPILFGVIAGKMLASNQQVSDSFINLGNTVQRDVGSMVDVMAGPALQASTTLGEGFKRMEPEINTAMIASAGYVDYFAKAATGLAENAMPGVVVAVKSALPVMQSLDTLSVQAGAGVSQMLINTSRGSNDAAAGLTTLSGSIRNVLAFAGNLVANLAANHNELGLLDTSLTQVEHALLMVTASGSGAIGFLHGFGAAGTGALTVLNGLLTVASALPPQITQFGGSFTASAMILKKFGVDATASFDGLGDRIKKAEGVGGTFKATMSGLAQGVLSPATLATAGLSIALWGLGEAQQKAAARAQEHASSVTQLTDAIRKDKGVISDASMETIAHSLAQKNTAANLDMTGLSFGKATVAASGNAQAMREVTDQTNHWIQVNAQKAGASQHDIDLIKGANQLLAQQGGAYSELNPIMKAAGQSQDQITQSNQAFSNVMARLGPQQAANLQAMLNGTGAVGEQARAVREAYDAYQLQEQGLTNLSEAQIKARDATSEHTQSIYEQVNASLGLRGAQMNSAQALEEYNKALKGGDEQKKAQDLLHLEEAWQAELTAVQKSTTEHSTATTEAGRNAEGLAAMNARAVQLASTFQGPLPASLAETIGRMSATEAKAAGVTIAIDGTGNAVYRLPNGKFVNITTSADQAAARVESLRDQINALHNRELSIVVTTFYGTAGQGASLTGPRVARAMGGPIGHAAEGGARSGLTLVGENGPELVRLPVGSMVNPAGASSTQWGGGGSSGVQEVRLAVDLSGADAGLLDWLKDRIRVNGGDVQLVLGVN